MPREISDEEYNFLQQRRQIADFVEPIYQHPKWGREAKRLIKQVYPQVNIPDYDITEQVDQRFEAEKKERQEAETARKHQEEDDAWRKERARVKDEYKFTDEGLQRLEKFMIDNKVGSYEVAASYMAAKEPKPIEATYDQHFWNHDKQEDFQKIAADPEKYAFNEIVQAIHRDELAAKQMR